MNTDKSTIPETMLQTYRDHVVLQHLLLDAAEYETISPLRPDPEKQALFDQIATRRSALPAFYGFDDYRRILQSPEISDAVVLSLASYSVNVGGQEPAALRIALALHICQRADVHATPGNIADILRLARQVVEENYGYEFNLGHVHFPETELEFEIFRKVAESDESKYNFYGGLAQRISDALDDLEKYFSAGQEFPSEKDWAAMAPQIAVLSYATHKIGKYLLEKSRDPDMLPYIDPKEITPDFFCKLPVAVERLARLLDLTGDTAMPPMEKFGIIVDRLAGSGPIDQILQDLNFHDIYSGEELNPDAPPKLLCKAAPTAAYATAAGYLFEERHKAWQDAKSILDGAVREEPGSLILLNRVHTNLRQLREQRAQQER